MINIENLNKYYGKTEVLKGLDLEIHPGEITGIVGRNGAGKSTLFKCIAGLEGWEGDIQPKISQLKIGLLETNPYFMDRMTGREYLMMIANAKNLKSKDIETKNLFELPLDQYASQFSTGMKKKLALTGILMQNCDLYLLDEPFNGVDLESNILLTEIIKELSLRQKMILLSSHLIQPLTEIAHTINVLDNKRIEQSYPKESFDRLKSDMMGVKVEDKLANFDLG